MDGCEHAHILFFFFNFLTFCCPCVYGLHCVFSMTVYRKIPKNNFQTAFQTELMNLWCCLHTSFTHWFASLTDWAQREKWRDDGVMKVCLPPQSPPVLSPLPLGNVKSIMQLSGSECSFLDFTDAPGHEASNVTERQQLVETNGKLDTAGFWSVPLWIAMHCIQVLLFLITQS